jgi:hypothetical protein
MKYYESVTSEAKAKGPTPHVAHGEAMGEEVLRGRCKGRRGGTDDTQRSVEHGRSLRAKRTERNSNQAGHRFTHCHCDCYVRSVYSQLLFGKPPLPANFQMLETVASIS